MRLLADVDATLGDLCGPATRAVLRRQLELFGDGRLERLAGLSNGHLYNLRKSRTYRCKRTVFTKTRSTPVAFGERRKPRPDGELCLRVDEVRSRAWHSHCRRPGACGFAYPCAPLQPDQVPGASARERETIAMGGPVRVSYRVQRDHAA